ncbi:hypothetical protein GOODEAATRI_000036, partial [Goodea atripinnis]
AMRPRCLSSNLTLLIPGSSCLLATMGTSSSGICSEGQTQSITSTWYVLSAQAQRDVYRMGNAAVVLLFRISHVANRDGEVVEQVISQQTAEPEEISVRRSSLLDEAIRQLRQQQDRQNQLGTEAAPGPEGRPEGPVLAPAPSTPRRGSNYETKQCRGTECP